MKFKGRIEETKMNGIKYTCPRCNLSIDDLRHLLKDNLSYSCPRCNEKLIGVKIDNNLESEK